MIFEEHNGLLQTKLALVSFFLVALGDWPLLALHSKIFLLFLTQTGFSNKSQDLRELLFPLGIYHVQSQQTDLTSITAMLQLQEKCYLTSCYYRKEKQITLYILVLQKSFIKQLYLRKHRNLLVRKTLQLNGVKKKQTSCVLAQLCKNSCL